MLQTGSTPIVVVSGRAFNERVDSLIGWPVTMDSRHEDNPFAVPIGSKRSGFGYVLCHRPLSVDWRKEGVTRHPWRRLDDAAFEAAMFKLNEVLSAD